MNIKYRCTYNLTIKEEEGHYDQDIILKCHKLPDLGKQTSRKLSNASIKSCAKLSLNVHVRKAAPAACGCFIDMLSDFV